MKSLSNILKIVIVSIIRFYQKWISPMKQPCCRFYPTCSQYAIAAILKYGVCKGLFMAAKRIVKCNIFHPGGYDPVI